MRAWIAAVVLLAACGDDGGRGVVALETAEDCNPMSWGTSCVLPWPSSLYETDGHLDFGATTLPATAEGVAFDPTRLNLRDGYASTSQIVWTVPGGLDAASLIPAREMARSLDDDAPTVLLDVDTGERVMHFSEIDVNSFHPDEQAIFVRPAQRLLGGHRYAVGFRVGSRPPAFQAIVDGTPTDHARLEAARTRLRDAYDRIGGDPVIAWDFTVATDEAIFAEPMALADAAHQAIGVDGADVTWTVDADDPAPEDPRQARTLELTFTVPHVAWPGIDGTETVAAHAFVPPCATAKTPAGILLYGHGFFGSLSEVRKSSWLRELAADACLVVVGLPWVGMTQDDISTAALALADLNTADAFAQHVWQGLVGFMAAANVLTGPRATELFGPIVDPSRVALFGLSQGHVLGSVLYAWEPALQRAVFHIGGGNWTLLFERSTNWALYGGVLENAYGDLLSAVIMEQVLGLAMERIDGAVIPPHDKPAVYSYSLADSTVPNLGTEFQLRTLRVPVDEPAPVVAPGLTTVADGAPTAVVVFQELADPPPPESNLVNRTGNDAHDLLRRRAAFRTLVGTFLATGGVTNPCGGVCACAGGACGPLLD